MKKKRLWMLLPLAAVLLAGVCLFGYGSSPAPVTDWEYTQELLHTKHRLSLEEDGTFRVLLISDMHCNSTDAAKTLRSHIRTLVDREHPSLVLFTGDNTTSMHSRWLLKRCLTILVSYLEEQGIPWAHVYGNHDDEGLFVLSREQQQPVYEQFAHCLSEAGADVSGVGNFVLPVYLPQSEKLAFQIWCLDSGTYMDANKNPDFIEKDQILWYRDAARRLSNYNGSPVPAMMVFHIPLPEAAEACRRYEEAGIPYAGTRGETVCHSLWNSGVYAQAQEQGDVRIIVSAHDHLNDYAVDHNGILLCASSTIGTCSTYYPSDRVGGRVVTFRLQAQQPFTTYMSYLPGTPRAYPRPTQVWFY